MQTPNFGIFQEIQKKSSRQCSAKNSIKSQSKLGLGLGLGLWKKQRFNPNGPSQDGNMTLKKSFTFRDFRNSINLSKTCIISQWFLQLLSTLIFGSDSLKMFFFSTANAHFSYLTLRIYNCAMHQCLFILSVSHCAPPLNYFNGDHENQRCKWRPKEIVLSLFISI